MYSSLNVGEKTWIIIALNANETAFLIGVTTVTGLALFPISKEDGVTHMFWLRLSHKNTSNNVTQVMRALTTHALVCTPHHTRTVLYLYLYYSTVVHVYCTVVQYVGGTVCNWLSRMLFAVISEKDGSCGSIIDRTSPRRSRTASNTIQLNRKLFLPANDPPFISNDDEPSKRR